MNKAQPNSQLPLAVVTVTYSPGEHLARFIDSLPAASYVVLADNGSTDGVPEHAAQQADNVEFLPTGGNLGYGGGVNAGVRAARQLRDRQQVRADYLLIANPDVVFRPGAIEALVDCAQRHPQAGAVGPRIIDADGSTYPSARAVPTLFTGIGHALFADIWPSNPWSRAYREESDMDSERAAGWLSGSCLLVRWEAFERIGGFDERYFMYMEDVDFGDRLARAGYENIYCPSAEISHAQGHSTAQVSAAMLAAHHRSAYRFQADRHSHAWQWPLRVVLKLGLSARAFIMMQVKRKSAGHSQG